MKEGFSYGGRLCSIVGWLGYGGNLTWRKQEYFFEYVLGVPISQGSLAKMQRWFQESLEPCYQQWLTYVKQPGVRCVDETTYCARWHQVLALGSNKRSRLCFAGTLPHVVVPN